MRAVAPKEKKIKWKIRLGFRIRGTNFDNLYHSGCMLHYITLYTATVCLATL
jgi:hypothetical protein